MQEPKLVLKMRGVALLAAVLGGFPAGAQSVDAGNAATGKLVFLQCQACHAVTPGAAALVGPDLAGVYGRKAGALAGYNYSTALKASGIVWSAGTLDAWLTNPASLVPGTKMAFVGIASQKLRADVIAYLKTLK
jgi:cytochrome c